MTGPPETDDEQQRLTSTLHALDHASRLAEAAGGGIDFGTVTGGPEDARAGALCADAMRSAAEVAGKVEMHSDTAAAQAAPSVDAASDAPAVSIDAALERLEQCAKELSELRRAHRSATLGAVADGKLTTDAAITRVETVRGLEALAYHAWRCTLHLVGRV